MPRGTWGFGALEQATVLQVAELDRVPSLADPQVRRCGKLGLGFICAVAVVLGLANLFPDEARVFANRVLLGKAIYPRRTMIARFELNGTTIIPAEDPPELIRVPTGTLLEVSVDCTGVTPDEGSLLLTMAATDQHGIVPLEVAASSASGDVATRHYSATGHRILEDLLVRVRIGDSETEPVRIQAVAPPAISIELSATPPDYATESEPIASVGSPPQISVVPGSRVEMTVRCRNKALQSASVRINGKELQLEQESPDGQSWRIPRTGSPLDSVASPLTYDLSVVDVDGLSLREPLQGTIGLLPDEPPRAVLGVATQSVLPAAEPSLVWSVTDNYGVKSVRLQWQVSGAAGTRDGVVPLPFQPKGKSAPRSAEGAMRFPLSPLQAVPGDEIRLTLSATDDRGTLPGVESASDSVILRVTDEAGILSALAERDQQSATQLDELINRQLESGASP